MEHHDDVNLDEYEYPELELIVCKLIKIPPKTGKNSSDNVMTECAYIDGKKGELYNSMHVRINKMSAGKYLVLYKCDFPGK